MRRRRLLAALAGAGSLGLAGCGSRSEGPTTTFAPPEETPDPATTTPPVVPTGDVSAGCPDFGRSVARVICTAAVDDETMAMRGDRGTAVRGGPGIAFSIENTRGVPYVTSPRRWTLHKRVDGEWFWVAPIVLHPFGVRLADGDGLEWSVRATEVDLPSFRTTSDPDAVPTDRLDLGALGGGRYAFGVQGYFEGVDYRGEPGGSIAAFVAPFEIEGSDIDLVASDRVRRTVRDGDRLRVERGPPAERTTTVTLTRGETTVSTIRLVTEQLYRLPLLRDGLAAFEAGVRQVVVETPPADGSVVDSVSSARYGELIVDVETGERTESE